MRRALLLAALVCAAASCKKPPPVEETSDTTSAPAPTAPAKPVDHLAADELLEGSETAFGVKLPRVLSVSRRYSDEVHAQGTAPFGQVIAYFKSHVREAKVTTGKRTATISRGKVPAMPGEVVDIRIDNVVGDDVKVVIRNSTPPPPPLASDEATIRKSVGLTPDGKGLLNPSHID